MADTTPEDYLATAVQTDGSRYSAARDALLEAHEGGDATVLAVVSAAAADGSDWRRQLSSQMIGGWIQQRALFEQTTAYARGNLPGPEPLPGFTAAMRGEAIAALGSAAVPRVLEMLWKSQDYGDDKTFSALFTALTQLEDPRALEPMRELTEASHPAYTRTSAIRVLTALRDPAVTPLLLDLAGEPATEPAVREYAIRSLGKVADPRAGEQLTAMLLDQDASIEERRLAAEGLELRLDPATRPAVVAALDNSFDVTTLLTLVRVLGEIGEVADIPALQQTGLRGQEFVEPVEFAIDAIRRSAPDEPRP